MIPESLKNFPIYFQDDIINVTNERSACAFKFSPLLIFIPEHPFVLKLVLEGLVPNNISRLDVLGATTRDNCHCHIIFLQLLFHFLTDVTMVSKNKNHYKLSEIK